MESWIVPLATSIGPVGLLTFVLLKYTFPKVLETFQQVLTQHAQDCKEEKAAIRKDYETRGQDKIGSDRIRVIVRDELDQANKVSQVRRLPQEGPHG